MSLEKLNQAQVKLEDAQIQINEAYELIESYKQDVETSLPPLNLFLYVNAGHGGLDENGNYHTFPQDGKYYIFQDNEGNEIYRAYEGETNRLVANEFMKLLDANNIPYMQIHNDLEDMLNSERIAKANNHYKTIQHTHKACWVSFHSNAVGMSYTGVSQSPKGYMIITSPNTTKSDGIAKNVFYEQYNLAKNSITYRYDITDADKNPDYDMKLYELTATLMNAILIENLFFTNLEDAKKLKTTDYQKLTAQATFEGIMKSFLAGIM